MQSVTIMDIITERATNAATVIMDAAIIMESTSAEDMNTIAADLLFEIRHGKAAYVKIILQYKSRSCAASKDLHHQ